MGIPANYRSPTGKILPGATVSPDEILSRLRSFFETREEILLAYLFGSLARGESGPTSDIDIAVLLRREIPVESLSDVYQTLYVGIYEALGTERFDLILLNGASLTLKFEIISQGKLIYARNDLILNDFEMNVLRQYQDTAYFRAVQDRYLQERIRQWYSK